MLLTWKQASTAINEALENNFGTDAKMTNIDLHCDRFSADIKMFRSEIFYVSLENTELRIWGYLDDLNNRTVYVRYSAEGITTNMVSKRRFEGINEMLNAFIMDVVEGLKKFDIAK